MMRSGRILALLIVAVAAPARARAQAPPRTTWREPAIHYGKWLTAGATVAFTVFAAREHRSSRRDWDALLTICRSSQSACEVGTDGRYLRSDAELLYERSQMYDGRANKRLLGAQASLLATVALFVLDLHPGREGPDNIPFSPLRVTAEPTGDGARVGVQLRF